MKTFALCVAMLLPATFCWGESESGASQNQKPNLIDHFQEMEQLQQQMPGRSLDEQARLQPQMQRAEREACRRLAKDRQDHVSQSEYQRQGGADFSALVLQFERYCETLR